MLLINPHMYVNVVVFVYYKLSRLCSVLLRGKSGDNPDPTLVSCLLLGYPSFLSPPPPIQVKVKDIQKLLKYLLLFLSLTFLLSLSLPLHPVCFPPLMPAFPLC